MKFIIFLKHGLGNKLYVLFNGTCLAKYYDIEPIIYSVISNHEEKKDTYELTIFTDKKIIYIDKNEFKNIIDQIHLKKYIRINRKTSDILCNKNIKNQYDVCYIEEYYYFSLIKNYGYHVAKIFKNAINYSVPYTFDKYINYIGIHIRTGDYVFMNMMKKFQFHLLSPEFYCDMLKKIIDKNKTYKILFFTNDTNNFINKYILKYINLPNCSYEISTNTPTIDMLILSKCKYIICSASTFSIWAGMLSNNSIIYYPGYGQKSSSKWISIKLNKYNKKRYVIKYNELQKYFPISYDTYLPKVYQRYKNIHINK